MVGKNLLSLLRLPHDDRHLQRRTLTRIGTRTPSPTMTNKLDWCVREKISDPLRTISQFYNENKDNKILTVRKNERVRQKALN